MSNKEKYVNTIALLVQSRSTNPRKAHDRALKSFDGNMEEMPKIPYEAMQEALSFLITATGCIREVLDTPSGWFLTTVMDDVLSHLHPYVCERCRAGQVHDVEDVEEDEAPPMASSALSTFLQQIGATAVDIAQGRTPEEAVENLKGKIDKKKN